MAGDWALALDGGGTKTAAALASREGEVAILSEGAGCNPQDGPGWDGVLADVLGRAARVEGGLAAAVLGIPGRGEVPHHDEAVDALLLRLLPCPHEAMNDVALAHLGAFGGGEGVLLLAGTGSMAWARGPAGEARVGGWGHAFGDEGSAHWIGRETLMVVSRIIDGRLPPDDAFVGALLTRLGPEAVGGFAPLGWVMAQGPRSRAAIASLAVHVDALAEDGHAAAIERMSEAADDLSWLARAAARRAGLPEPFPWVAAGSVFRSKTLTAGLADWIGRPVQGRLTTLAGGLQRAARLAGWDVGEAWAAQVDARLRAHVPTP